MRYEDGTYLVAPPRPALCCLLAASLLVTSAGEARAYCILTAMGKVVRWRTQPVVYRVSSNLTDAGTLAAIDKAVQTWASVTCSKLTFKKGSSFSVCTTPTCADFATPKDAIFIHWVTTTSTLFTPSSGTTPYFTNYSYTYDMMGGFGGAAVAVNAKDYQWNTTGGDKTKGIFDVWNMMVNLLGWTIGLDDSSVAGASMSKVYSFGDTTKQTLAQDDINGVLWLYGKTGCSSTAPTPPDKTCASGSNPPKADGGSLTPDGGTTTKDSGIPAKDTGGTVPKDTGGAILDQGAPGLEIGTTKPDYGAGQDAAAADDSGVVRECITSSQCAGGQFCSAEGKCIKAAGGDEGCSCSLGQAPLHTGINGGPALLLLAGLGAWGLRRRRRARWR